MCLYPGDRGFYCFSCHAHGDATRLYQQALGLPPLEAARRVCRDFGLAYDHDRRESRARTPPPRTADARTLAARLAQERERRAAQLLSVIRAAGDGMETIEQRMLAEGADYAQIYDDPVWGQLLIERTAAQEELSALDGMSLADVLNDLRAQAERSGDNHAQKGE